MSRRLKLPAGMFGSEEELCEQLRNVARAAGYQVHAEVGGWDLLIVCRETGDQCGVQAKLRASVGVVAQALNPEENQAGPEVHAVLVPYADNDFLHVARKLRLLVVQGVHLDRFELGAMLAHAPRWQHRERTWAPEVEVHVPAGVPSPRRVTPWKVAAVKIALIARARGFVTREDFKLLKIAPGWFLSSQSGPLLIPRTLGTVEVVTSRCREYVLADPSSPMVPDLRFPEVVEALQRNELPLLSLDESPLPPPPRLPTIEPERPARGPRERVRVRQSEVRAKLASESILPPSGTANSQDEWDEEATGEVAVGKLKPPTPARLPDIHALRSSRRR